MKIFVSGGTGVLGRRVVPLLLRAGHVVSVGVRNEASRILVTKMQAAPVMIDLFDRDSVSIAVRGCRVIINLATSIPVGLRAFLPWSWKTNDRIRRIGVSNLVDAALECRVQRFLQESFAPMYASGGGMWLTEDSAVDLSRHVRSAADAENAVLALNQAGITAVVLRFSMFYGPDSAHMRDLARFVTKGRAATFGDPVDYVSSISTDDAAAAVVAALSAPGGVYNVTDDEPVTKRQYFSSLARALGVAEPRFFPAWSWRLAGSLGDILRRSHRISNAKFKAATAWRPGRPAVVNAWSDVVAAMK